MELKWSLGVHSESLRLILLVQESQRFGGRGMKVMVMYARRNLLEQQRAYTGTVRKQEAGRTARSD